MYHCVARPHVPLFPKQTGPIFCHVWVLPFIVYPITAWNYTLTINNLIFRFVMANKRREVMKGIVKNLNVNLCKITVQIMRARQIQMLKFCQWRRHYLILIKSLKIRLTATASVRRKKEMRKRIKCLALKR